MEKRLLWIVKDARSKHLSRSSRAEEAKIRHHVQRRQSALEQDYSLDVRLLTSPKAIHAELRNPERRGLQFFVERTAPEWSGWQDEHFWNILVIQVSQHHRAVVHGLIAIASYHEASLIRSEGAEQTASQRCFALSQFAKALGIASRANDASSPANLICCVILASLQAYNEDYQFYRLLRSGRALLEDTDEHWQPRQAADISTVQESVRPLFSRMHERLCMMGDQHAALAYSVRNTKRRRRCLSTSIPTTFAELRAARDCLEAILDWSHDQVFDTLAQSTAYSFFRSILTERISRWQQALDLSKLPVPQTLTLGAINAVILLSTLSLDPLQETAFDAHVDDFSRIMDMVESLPLEHQHRPMRISFGIDGGLLDIVAFVASRCREPIVRCRALIWLETFPRYEGERLSTESAVIAKLWNGLETETALSGATQKIDTANDVPELARRRLLRGERYTVPGFLKLNFGRSAYIASTANSNEDEIWLDIANAANLGSQRPSVLKLDVLPDVIFEPGHAAFLDQVACTYHHMWTEKFYFPIPKV